MGLKIGKISKRTKTALLLVLVYFVMLMFYINEPFFESDEGDIYMVGAAIANGRLLYRDITSQHMPVMYYIAAVFSLLGASTITAFRIWFYLLMAVFWGVMYYRYSEHLNKKAVALYPMIYIMMLSRIDLGHTVLSDQFQGIGMAILLFELLIFEKTRELKAGNMIMISLAVFLSFGSAFVAAFAVFFVALTVIVLELQRFAQMKLGPVKSVCKLFCTYWKLVVYVAAPFVLLLLFFVVTGTLDEFYDWAYLINCTVYPKYSNYGGSILDSMFGGANSIMAALALPTAGSTINQIVFFAVTASAAYFFVRLQKERKNWILTGGVLLLWIGAATRGYMNFHGTPAVAVVCIMCACALCGIIDELKKSTIAVSIVALALVCFSAPYISLVVNFSPMAALRSFKVAEDSHSYVIDLITEDKEVVGLSTLNTNYIFESNTSPTKLNAACVWIWEFGGKEDLQRCIDNPPRVFVYDPGYAVGGYSIRDYAVELDLFIHENYTDLGPMGYPTLYVRNDYYEEALEIINEDSIRRTGCVKQQIFCELDSETNTMKVNLVGGNAYQAVSFVVWTEENGQDDLRWYEAKRSLDGSWAYTIDLEDHQSQGLCYVHVYVSDGQTSNMLRQISLIVE